jgi:hypothetical protein
MTTDQRTIDEYEQLTKKVVALFVFIHSQAFTSVQEDERARLIHQHEVMEQYRQILDERLRAVGIDPSNPRLPAGATAVDLETPVE